MNQAEVKESDADRLKDKLNALKKLKESDSKLRGSS